MFLQKPETDINARDCDCQVPERLYQLVDRSTDGLVTADQVMEFIAGLQAIKWVHRIKTHDQKGQCTVQSRTHSWKL